MFMEPRLLFRNRKIFKFFDSCISLTLTYNNHPSLNEYIKTCYIKSSEDVVYEIVPNKAKCKNCKIRSKKILPNWCKEDVKF
jgi:hypothetical protein